MFKTIILISFVTYAKAQYYQAPCLQRTAIAPSPCQTYTKPCDLPGLIPVANTPYEIPVPVMAAPTYIPANLPCLEPPMPSCQNNIYIPEPIVGNPLAFLESMVAPCADLPLPLGLANPFLPVASPVSAMAPMLSPFLPPAGACGCRCQYLKKIPIPPPCI